MTARTKPPTFDEWKIDVIAILKKRGFNDRTIASVDWIAWRELYYEYGLSPLEAVVEDMLAAS